MLIRNSCRVCFALALSISAMLSQGHQCVIAQELSSSEKLPFKYCGHSVTHKFHRFTCPFGSCISKRHLVLFHFRKEAIDSHFAPCKYCLPPVWWSVHGVVLNKKNVSPAEDQNISEKQLEQVDMRTYR